MSQKVGEKSQVLPTCLYATADCSAPNVCNLFVGCGEGVCPKALQILPESDEVCEHSGKKTDILMEVWQLPHPISQPPVAQFSQFFWDARGGACLNTLQVLPECDQVCEHSSQKTGKALLLIVHSLQNINLSRRL